jgi:hypothetical protein
MDRPQARERRCRRRSSRAHQLKSVRALRLEEDDRMRMMARRPCTCQLASPSKHSNPGPSRPANARCGHCYPVALKLSASSSRCLTELDSPGGIWIESADNAAATRRCRHCDSCNDACSTAGRADDRPKRPRPAPRFDWRERRPPFPQALLRRADEQDVVRGQPAPLEHHQIGRQKPAFLLSIKCLRLPSTRAAVSCRRSSWAENREIRSA